MKLIRIISVCLMGFVGANALVAGLLLIIDPSGTLIKMPDDVLISTPFKNFLIPGIILFTLNGVLNLVAVVATLFWWRKYAVFILLQGLVLIGWITVQVIMLGSVNFLHVTMFSIGFLLFSFGLWLNSGMPVQSK